MIQSSEILWRKLEQPSINQRKLIKMTHSNIPRYVSCDSQYSSSANICIQKDIKGRDLIVFLLLIPWFQHWLVWFICMYVLCILTHYAFHCPKHFCNVNDIAVLSITLYWEQPPRKFDANYTITKVVLFIYQVEMVIV